MFIISESIKYSGFGQDIKLLNSICNNDAQMKKTGFKPLVWFVTMIKVFRMLINTLIQISFAKPNVQVD